MISGRHAMKQAVVSILLALATAAPASGQAQLPLPAPPLPSPPAGDEDPSSPGFRTLGAGSVYDGTTLGGVQHLSLPMAQGTCPHAALYGFAKCLLVRALVGGVRAQSQWLSHWHRTRNVRQHEAAACGAARAAAAPRAPPHLNAPHSLTGTIHPRPPTHMFAAPPPPPPSRPRLRTARRCGA